MPRIATTLDRDLDRRLRAEAQRRGITRARLLREAAIHYLGTSEGARGVAELRSLVAAQEARLERLERQLAVSAPGWPAERQTPRRPPLDVDERHPADEL